MKKYLILIYIILNGGQLIVNDRFNFPNILSRLEGKIFSIKRTNVNSDFFEIPLTSCYKKFYNGLKNRQTYMVTHRKSEENIFITEYIFDDTKSAKSAFIISKSYADIVRNTPRSEYTKLCLEDKSFLVFYVTQKHNHLYLYGSIYNYKYPTNKSCLEDILKIDKNVYVDDLYKKIKSMKD